MSDSVSSTAVNITTVCGCECVSWKVAVIDDTVRIWVNNNALRGGALYLTLMIQPTPKVSQSKSKIQNAECRIQKCHASRHTRSNDVQCMYGSVQHIHSLPPHALITQCTLHRTHNVRNWSPAFHGPACACSCVRIGVHCDKSYMHATLQCRKATISRCTEVMVSGVHNMYGFFVGW